MARLSAKPESVLPAAASAVTVAGRTIPERQFAVAVLVVHGPCALLLLHRKLNLWLPPGGHVEPDELPPDAARREVWEETGLEVNLLGPMTDSYTGVWGLPAPLGMQLEDIVPGGHQHIDCVYLARLTPGSNVTPLINHESRQLGWYAPADFADLGVNAEIRGWVRQALQATGWSAAPHAIFDQGFRLAGPRVQLHPWRPADLPSLVSIWTDGRVMRNVGFPDGLDFGLAKATEWLVDRYVGVDFVHRGLNLAVTDEHGQVIGEAKIGRAEGLNQPGGAPCAWDERESCGVALSEPDCKLLPDFWGRGLGREIWQLMVDYTFANVAVDVIQVTPNVRNERALRLYTGLGFTPVGPVTTTPADPGGPTAPVTFQTMWLKRSDWSARPR